MGFSLSRLLVGAVLVGAAFVPGLQGVSIAGLTSLAGLSFAAGLAILGTAFTPSASQRQDGVLNSSLSTQNYVPIIYGSGVRVGLRLSDYRVNTASVDDRDLYVVGALCMGSRNGAPNNAQISAIKEIYFDDHLAVRADGVVTDRFSVAGGFWIGPGSQTGENGETPNIDYAKHLGARNQTVDAKLNAEFPTVYDTNHAAKGIAYLLLVFRYKKDMFPGKTTPAVTVRVDGRVVWDPRLGVSSSPANWALSDNPALCLLDYLLDPISGPGVLEAKIDTAPFIAMANYCDEMVSVPDDLGGSTTQKRFRARGVVDTGRPIHDNIAELLTTCRGDLVYQAGTYRLHIRRDVGTGPFGTITLTALDYILDEPDWEWTARGSDSRFNVVKAKYIDPDHQDQPLEAQWPEPGANSYLAADNGIPSILSVDLPYTMNYHMAKQIAMTLLKESREGIGVALTCTEAALTLQVGDVVTVTHDTPGWSAKPFWVRAIVINPDATVRLALLEYQPNVYSYDALSDKPTFPDTVLTDGLTIAPPTGLTLVSDGTTALVRGDGSVVERIKATWTRSADPRVDYTEVQAKKTSDTAWDTFGRVDEAIDQLLFIPEVVKGESWDVRIRAVTVDLAVSVWVTGTIVVGSKSTAPGAPTGLAGTFSRDGISLKWDKHADIDFAAFELREGASWAAGVFLQKGDQTFYVIQPQDITKRSYTFRLKAINRTGVESAEATLNLSDTAPDATQLVKYDTTIWGRVMELFFSGGNASGATEVTLHASTTTGFTAGSTNQVAAAAIGTFDRFGLRHTVPAGTAVGTTIYFRVRAKDWLTDQLSETPSVMAEFSQTFGQLPTGDTGALSVLYFDNISQLPDDDPPIACDQLAYVRVGDLWFRWDCGTLTWHKTTREEISDLNDGDRVTDVEDQTDQYRTTGVPTNSPSPSGITITANADGSRDITVWWAYTQGAKIADSFIVYAKWDSHATIAGSGTDEVGITKPATTLYHRFAGVYAGRIVRIGIAAARRTENGLEIGPVQQPTSAPDWTVDAGTPAIGGTTTIDGTPASTLKTEAEDAFDGTAVYRAPGAPTNSPAPSGITVTENANGSRDILLSWSAYSQGALPANYLVVFVKWGSQTTIASTEKGTVVPITSTSYRIEGVYPKAVGRFGIAAARLTDAGVQMTAIVQPTSAPDWRANASAADGLDLVADGTAYKKVVSSFIDGSGRVITIWSLDSIEVTGADAYVGAQLSFNDSNATPHIGNQRKIPQAQTAGRVSAPTGYSGSLLSATTTQITVAAFTMQYGGFTVSFGGGTISGLSASTKYYVYVDDSGYAGSTSYVATTNWETVLGNINRVHLGTITTPSSGTSTGNPAGGWCVAMDSIVSRGLRALDVRPGMLLRVLSDDRKRVELRAVEKRFPLVEQSCVRIAAPSGAAVVVSRETPLTLRDGSSVYAGDANGLEIPTLVDGILAWEIAEVEPVGPCLVAPIGVGNRCFAAGESAERLVFTHNTDAPKGGLL